GRRGSGAVTPPPPQPAMAAQPPPPNPMGSTTSWIAPAPAAATAAPMPAQPAPQTRTSGRRVTSSVLEYVSCIDGSLPRHLRRWRPLVAPGFAPGASGRRWTVFRPLPVGHATTAMVAPATAPEAATRADRRRRFRRRRRWCQGLTPSRPSKRLASPGPARDRRPEGVDLLLRRGGGVVQALPRHLLAVERV